MRFIGKFVNAQLGWEIRSSRISLSVEAFHSGSLMKVWEVDALDAVCDSNECFEIPNPDFVSHHGKQLVKRANTVLPVKKKKTPLRLTFMSSTLLWQYGAPAQVERKGKEKQELLGEVFKRLLCPGKEGEARL